MQRLATTLSGTPFVLFFFPSFILPFFISFFPSVFLFPFLSPFSFFFFFFATPSFKKICEWGTCPRCSPAGYALVSHVRALLRNLKFWSLLGLSLSAYKIILIPHTRINMIKEIIDFLRLVSSSSFFLSFFFSFSLFFILHFREGAPPLIASTLAPRCVPPCYINWLS